MQVFMNFLFLSSTYLSFSLGLALVFGVTRIINFAHGELYMLGGYVLWMTSFLLVGVVPSPVIFLIAIVLAPLLIGLIGWVIQKGIVDRLKGQQFSIFIATLALSYVLQVIVIQTIGPAGRSIPPMFSGIIWFQGAILPVQRLVVVGFVALMLFALWYILVRTDIGRAMRAAAQNETGARLQGVHIDYIGVVTIMLGASLAAMAGVLNGSLLGVTPFMGGEAIWRAFLIIIVGGVGSIPGAILAAFLFGALDTGLTATGNANLITMVDAIIMLLILSFRPNGLLGTSN